MKHGRCSPNSGWLGGYRRVMGARTLFFGWSGTAYVTYSTTFSKTKAQKYVDWILNTRPRTE
jgi:hypothetical protein